MNSKVHKTAYTSSSTEDRIAQNGPSVKKDTESYSIPEDPYTEYDKPITLDDVNILRSIGRKSINDFTSEDIQKSQKWAHKFYKELGTKSPFFRAWFGDWRAYDDKTRIGIVDTIKDNRKSVVNKYTDWDIQTSKKVHKETSHHSGSPEVGAIKYLPYIDDITEKAVLFDSMVSDKENANSLMFHTMYAYTEVLGYPALLKIRVEELFYHNRETSGILRRDYILQNIEEESLSKRNRLSRPNHLNQNSSTISISELFSLVKQYDKDFNPKPVDSHLLNEDGFPKKVYHSTDEKFNIFDITKSRSWHGTPDYDLPGFYFSLSKNKEPHSSLMHKALMQRPKAVLWWLLSIGYHKQNYLSRMK